MKKNRIFNLVLIFAVVFTALGWSISADATMYNVPSLSYPTNNQILTNYPRVANFNWSSIYGANNYQVEIACDICISKTIKWQNARTYNVVGNTFSVTVPGADNQFRWRVRAVGNMWNNQAGQWSEFKYFTFNTKNQTKLNTPSVYLPNNGEQYNQSSIYFDWSDVSSATKYGYEVHKWNTVVSQWESKDSQIISSAISAVNYNISNWGDGQFRYRVYAEDNSGNKSEWSAWRYFYNNYSDWQYYNVGQTDSYYNPQSPPTITEPYANQYYSSGQAVTTRWNSVSNAVSYNVRVEYKSGSNWLLESNTNVTSLYLTKYFSYANEYRVQVKANFSDGNYTNWSDYRYFNYNNSGSYYGYTYTAPIISTPTENQTLYSRYVFPTWNTISGAVSYEINVNYKSGTGWYEEGLYTSVLTSVGLDLKYTNEYRVRARAKFSDGTYTSWSDWRLFRVQL